MAWTIIVAGSEADQLAELKIGAQEIEAKIRSSFGSTRVLEATSVEAVKKIREDPHDIASEIFAGMGDRAPVELVPDRARAIGRPRVQKPYLGLVNYTNNLRRLGWGDDDLRDGGSDALIDALVAWGSPDEVAARLNEHFEAGADHVAVQLLTATDAELLDGYRTLAQALGLSA